MSAAPIPSAFGSDLTDDDYRRLAERAISRELANYAGIRRVDSYVGREMFGRKKGDLAGIIIPNIFPGEGSIREYRLRLDRPELEQRIDGTVRERAKYLQPTERRNILYFPPGTAPQLLVDANVLLIITEGEFKSLALWSASIHQSTSPRFAVLSVPGVWNFRGTVGKTIGPDGERRDVKGVVPDVDRISLKDRRVIIAFDADAESNPKVRAARWQLSAALMERGATVGLLEWPIEEGKGIDDRIAKLGAARVLEDIARVQFGDWHSRLLRNDAGKLIPCLENVALSFENSPEWAGTLGYNEFDGGYYVLRAPPPPITAAPATEIEDHFDVEVTRWCERRGLMVKPPTVRLVVDAAARRNPYHPVREFLEGLPPWDGVPRVGSWLIDYCNVQSSDSEPNLYAMTVGEKFLISAIARAMDPGCKADHMLVLEGAQGLGKSTAARILAGDAWFTDRVDDLGSKDASMQLRGVWIVELAELEAFSRVEMARAKAFITQQVERFRVPYGKRVVRMPRQCVFIGTTNSEIWLLDPSGGRRFWPVCCRGPIDVDGLRRDRNQLWVEALAQYCAGVPWWLEDREVIQEATEQQRGRYQDDPWQERVIAHAFEEAERSTSAHPDGRGSASVPEILGRLGVETAKQDQSAANRVARCLKVAGWERFQARSGTAREWRYRSRNVDAEQRLMTGDR